MDGLLRMPHEYQRPHSSRLKYLSTNNNNASPVGRLCLQRGPSVPDKDYMELRVAAIAGRTPDAEIDMLVRYSDNHAFLRSYKFNDLQYDLRPATWSEIAVPVNPDALH